MNTQQKTSNNWREETEEPKRGKVTRYTLYYVSMLLICFYTDIIRAPLKAIRTQLRLE